MRRQRYLLADLDKTGRTALLMPVYHEDPETVAKALARMGRAIAGEMAADKFDIYVLSDSREPAHIRHEAQIFSKLRHDLADVIAVYYRRRADNHHKKAGNIADFVTRWGGAYPQMVVLDADSLMTADAIIRLAATMEADPDAGIVQSLPLQATAPEAAEPSIVVRLLRQVISAVCANVVPAGVGSVSAILKRPLIAFVRSARMASTIE